MAHGNLHKRQKASNPARQINNRSLTHWANPPHVPPTSPNVVHIKRQQNKPSAVHNPPAASPPASRQRPAQNPPPLSRKKNRTFNVYEDTKYMMMIEEDKRGKEIEKVYSSVPPSHFVDASLFKKVEAPWIFAEEKKFPCSK
jgi:hypothetical protein